MSKGIGIAAGVVAVAVVAFGALWLTDVDVTSPGELPSVDVKVDADGGELPGVDVDTADIDVKEEQVTVDVPEVDVKTEEKTITVPTLEMTPPDASGDAKERSPEINPGEGQ